MTRSVKSIVIENCDNATIAFLLSSTAISSQQEGGFGHRVTLPLGKTTSKSNAVWSNAATVFDGRHAHLEEDIGHQGRPGYISLIKSTVPPRSAMIC
jgi:hypothetical protein